MSSLMSFLLLNSVYGKVGRGPTKNQHEHSESLPNLYDTLRIMKHKRGVDQALLYLKSLGREQLLILKSPPLLKQLAHVACLQSDQPLTAIKYTNTQDVDQEIRRALEAIDLLSKIQAPPTCLVERWLKPGLLYKTKLVVGDHPLDLLSRASALALRQAGRVDLLTGMTKHFDPEVREHAAHAGADPDHLCSRLRDPWKAVRFGAIRGLEKVSAPAGLCLIKALKTLDDDLRLRAVIALGRFADTAWAKETTTPAQLSHVLRSLTQDSSEGIPLRRAALVALARWGISSEAEAIVRAHLKSGGLDEMTRGALHALISSRARHSRELIHRILSHSDSTVLKLDALRWLNDPRSGWDDLIPPYTAKDRLLFVESLLKDATHHPLYRKALYRLREGLKRVVYGSSRYKDTNFPLFDQEDEP